jgi:hypothetical protein
MLVLVLPSVRYSFEIAEAFRRQCSANNYENKDRTKDRRWQNTVDRDVKDRKLPFDWEIEDSGTSLY